MQNTGNTVHPNDKKKSRWNRNHVESVTWTRTCAARSAKQALNPHGHPQNKDVVLLEAANWEDIVSYTFSIEVNENAGFQSIARSYFLFY